jgi:hypothetical protein
MKRDTFIEIVIWIFALVFQAYYISDFLDGFSTLVHDNVYFNYPAFIQYFRNLSAGHLPVYNFLSRFGEPMVPVMAQMRLWDPLQTLLGLTLWKLFSDKVQVYNLARYLMVLAQAIGTYVYLRPTMKSHFTRFVVVMSLVCGSFFFGGFRQDGIINQFLWVPWILVLLRCQFLNRLPTVPACLALGMLIGSCFQSYFFLYTVIFIIAFLILWMFFVQPLPLRGQWRAYLLRILLVILTTVPMMAINVVTLLESKAWILPLRTYALETVLTQAFYPERLRQSETDAAKNVAMPGAVTKEVLLQSGGHSRFWDYIVMLDPRANQTISLDSRWVFGEPSEAFLYFGLFPLIMGFIGLYKARDGEGVVWMHILCMFILISLGKDGFVYLKLLNLFPFLSMVRNTHALVMYVEFAFMYFIAIGTNFFSDSVARIIDGK